VSLHELKCWRYRNCCPKGIDKPQAGEYSIDMKTTRNPKLCACCRRNQAIVFIPTVMHPERSIGYCRTCYEVAA